MNCSQISHLPVYSISCIIFNPITAPSMLNFRPEKCTHIRHQTVHLMVLQQVEFGYVHFDRNSFACSWKGEKKKKLKDFKFDTFIGHFQSDCAASVAAKGLRLCSFV